MSAQTVATADSKFDLQAGSQRCSKGVADRVLTTFQDVRKHLGFWAPTSDRVDILCARYCRSKDASHVFYRATVLTFGHMSQRRDRCQSRHVSLKIEAVLEAWMWLDLKIQFGGYRQPEERDAFCIDRADLRLLAALDNLYEAEQAVDDRRYITSIVLKNKHKPRLAALTRPERAQHLRRLYQDGIFHHSCKLKTSLIKRLTDDVQLPTENAEDEQPPPYAHGHRCRLCTNLPVSTVSVVACNACREHV